MNFHVFFLKIENKNIISKTNNLFKRKDFETI